MCAVKEDFTQKGSLHMVFGKGVEFVLADGSIIIWAELGMKLIGHLAILGQNGGKEWSYPNASTYC